MSQLVLFYINIIIMYCFNFHVAQILELYLAYNICESDKKL